MNTISHTSSLYNECIQTFREPFAALSRSFATAAKTHIHICRCHSDTKSLAWVLERLPHNINKYILYIHNQQLITIRVTHFWVIKHGWDVCSWATRSMRKLRLQTQSSPKVEGVLLIWRHQ